MDTQQIIWTALPNGRAARRSATLLRLAALASPRLTPDTPQAQLQRFPLWLDWPATVAQASFGVQFGDGPTLAARPLRPSLESALWTALFKPETLVRPFAFRDRSALPIISYPIGYLHDAVALIYGGGLLPPAVNIPDLDRLRVELRSFGANPGLAIEWLKRVLAEAGAVSAASVETIGQALIQLKTFYQPPPLAQPLQLPPDFHGAVAMLGQYPPLLRSLGLLVDLEVALPIGISLPRQGLLRLSVQMDDAVTPRTRYLIEPNAFRVPERTRGAALDGGMLRLEDGERFRLTQLDLEGALFKGLEQATDSNATPAALRTTGLTVNRVDRALDLKAALAKLAAANAALERGTLDEAEQAFAAEDLVRGYRMDIWDEQAGRWFTLHQRRGRFRFLEPVGGGSPLERDYIDEGWAGTNLAEVNHTNGSALLLHEAMLRWEGWSLAAPRPGKSVTNPEPGVGEAPVYPENEPTTAFKLQVSFTPEPGSLPRLRFGRTYRVRARAVDLAGNSLPPEPRELPGGHTSPSLRYRRMEPVAAPVVVGRRLPETMPSNGDPFLPGESAMRLVIRGDADGPTTQTSERHLAPPKAAQLLLEQHGLFDEAFGTARPEAVAAAYQLALREQGQLPALHDGEQLDLPYLPDPLAHGLVLWSKSQAGHFAAVYPGAWPGLAPIRLRLEDSGRSPANAALLEPGLIVLRLPKSQVVTAQLSSLLDSADLPLMGVVAMLEQLVATITAQQPEQAAALQAALAAILTNATQGKVAQLTPPRELTLVHAVRRPLEAPALAALVGIRSPGDTSVRLQGELECHSPSSGAVDVHAIWNDLIDDPSMPAAPVPQQRQGAAQVFRQELSYEQSQILAFDGAQNPRYQHAFGDTRHRVVHYTPTASSRFREYYAADEPPEAFQLSGVRVSLAIPSSGRPPAPTPHSVVPTFGWSRQKQPDDSLVVTRSGGGLRIYLERPWLVSGPGERLGVVLLNRDLAALGESLLRERLGGLVTQWGLDPVMGLRDDALVSTLSQRLVPETESRLFASRALAELGGEGLEGSAETPLIQLIHVPVAFSAERGLWHADLRLNPGKMYCPFVRLALVRYQPESLEGLWLSPVTLAEPIQLLPDRRCVVRLDNPQQVEVALLGASAWGYTGGPTSGTTDLRPNTVELQIEANTANGSELDWQPIGDGPTVLHAVEREMGAFWVGVIARPIPVPMQRHRLRISEYERFAPTPVAPPVNVSALLPPQPTTRLVFVETVDL
jgi:hypothetical protein